MFPVSHKTVIVLDNTHRFRSFSCKQPIEFDVGLKMKGNVPAGVIPLAPLCKSLWTSAIEAIQEYARIVYDLYSSNERLLSMVTVDDRMSSIVVDWNSDHNLSNLNSYFAKASLNTITAHGYPPSFTPKCEEDCFKSGLQVAMEALSTPTAVQRQMRRKDARANNRGRIMLISNFQNESQIRFLADLLADNLNKMNALLRNNQAETNRLPVNECHFTVVNTFPVDDPQVFQAKETTSYFVTPSFATEIHFVRGGTFLAAKLLTLVQSHYGLASTTVTGIPMKEEQNASSSANYDVEIMHPAEAHFNLHRFKNRDGQASTQVLKEDGTYETVPLKWCTPRSTSVELHHCSKAFRISPVDVNSRPSSCLTNFLLSGRTVMLELTKLKGSKVMSHMLSSHSGELYIHTLQTGRSLLEDPPSISEGIGGRITDYRINDFCELMKRNKLVPTVAHGKLGDSSPPTIDLSVSLLKRQTLYWPIVLGHTIIFNIQFHIQSLLNLILKESLTLDDVNECKSALYQIVKLESKGSSLNLSSISGRGKGSKKEELYKLLWRELDHFIQAHATTPEHNIVLNSLRDLHATQNTAPTSSSSTSLSNPVAKTEPPSPESRDSVIMNTESPMSSSSISVMHKDEAQVAWKELDAYNTLTEREKNDFNEKPPYAGNPTKKPRIQEGKMESNGASEDVEMRPIRSDASSNGSRSLLGLWTNKLNQNFNKRPDFKGRTFKIAPLYVHLNQPIE